MEDFDEFDDYIDSPIEPTKSTVVLTIYSRKGLEDVIEGYSEVVRALNKWAEKNILNSKNNANKTKTVSSKKK